MNQQRIDTFDNTRIMASLLNVVLHVLVPFMVYSTGMWPFSFGNSEIILPDIIVFIIHNSNMNVFFFMSGFFSVFLMKKSKNLNSFITNRFQKIIVPFLMAWIILIPLILLSFPIAFDIKHHPFQVNFHAWLYEVKYLFFKYKVPTGHLWFMFYWCIYFVIFILLNYFEHTKKLIEKVSSIIQPNTGIFLLILVSFICRTFTPDSIILNPLGAMPELHSLIYYLLYYLIGCLTYYWAIKNIKPHLKPKQILAFSILSTVITLVCLHFIKLNLHNSFPLKFTLLLFSTTSSISNSICIVLLSKKIKLDKLPKLLLESTYWVYIVHIPILIFIQLLFYYFNLEMGWSLILSLIIPYLLCLWFYSIFGRQLMRR